MIHQYVTARSASYAVSDAFTKTGAASNRHLAFDDSQGIACSQSTCTTVSQCLGPDVSTDVSHLLTERPGLYIVAFTMNLLCDIKFDWFSSCAYFFEFRQRLRFQLSPHLAQANRVLLCRLLACTGV